MARHFPALGSTETLSPAARLTGRFDALAHLAALETVTPASTAVTKAVNAVAEDRTYTNARRLAAQLTAPLEANPNAFRMKVAAYTGG